MPAGSSSARKKKHTKPHAGAGSNDRIEVFDYLDYRAFLRDYYANKKGRGLSFRVFSKRAGLRSPNYLKLVMEGARNLSEETAGRFAVALALKGDSKRYFLELVRFGQAQTSAARSTHYGRLTGFRRYREVRPLEAEQAAYHSTWYLPAVRELAARKDFRDDPSWIARMMCPAISVSEAARALDVLMKLGLLVRQADGTIGQGQPLLSTGPETPWHIADYHRTMLARAAAAIDAISPAERDISSLTMCLGSDGLLRFKNRIRRLRRELLELSTLESDPRQVVQLNFQLFPLSCPELPEETS